MSLRDLIRDAKQELKERFDNGETDRDDLIDASHEIADSFVPVYTRDLINLCQDDFSLFTDKPEIGPAFDGEPTPTNIVAANVYERLTQALGEYAEELLDSSEEAESA